MASQRFQKPTTKSFKVNPHKDSWASILVYILLFHICCSFAEPFSTVQVQVNEFKRVLKRQTEDIESMSKKLDRLSEEISSLKKKQNRGKVLLQQYRLQLKLQEAQALSDQLSSMAIVKRKTGEELKSLTRTLIRSLDQTIETNRKIANSADEPWNNRIQAARELEKLLTERMQISVWHSPDTLPSSAAPLLNEDSSLEEADERLDAYKDLERRMVKEVASIETELIETRRQSFLRRELAHLMDEEAFFSEQSFVRGSASKSQKESASILGKTKTTKEQPKDSVPSPIPPPNDSPSSSSTTIPSEDSGDLTAKESPSQNLPVPTSAAPTHNSDLSSKKIDSDVSVVPSPSNITNVPSISSPLPQGAAPAPSDLPSASPSGILVNSNGRIETSNSKSFLESNQEKGQRDPLAQLANEFGLPLELRKDLSYKPIASSSLDSHVQWLEKRLHTTRFILSRIREKVRNLEERLSLPR